MFKYIKKAIDYLLSKNITVSINSNATLLSEEIAKYLKKNKISLFISFPCGVEEICNLITNKDNSFKKITKGLNIVKKYGVHFTTNMVVSKLNINYIESTISFLKQNFDISKICLTRVGKPVNSDKSFNNYMLSHDDFKKMQEIILNASKKYNVNIDTACPYTPCSIYSKEAYEYFAYKKICTAGKTSYSIDTFGNVKACPRESITYGNILYDDFSKIWRNMKIWRDGSIIPVECKKCNKFSKCLGGCRMDSVPFTNKYNKLDCISNIANLPIVFEKQNDSSVEYNVSSILCIHKKLQFTKEKECCRVSNNGKYCYVTFLFASFLQNNQEFTIKDMITTFNLEHAEVYNIIDTLIINNIIYIKS